MMIQIGSEVVEWIKLDENTSQLRAHVNTAMKVRVI
jgi:hypothetical protein